MPFSRCGRASSARRRSTPRTRAPRRRRRPRVRCGLWIVRHTLVTVSDTRPWLRMPRRNRSTGEALSTQLFDGALRLLEAVEAHAAQDLLRLRELDVAVVDDLDLISPRVEEIEPAPGRDRDTELAQTLAHGLLVVDDEAEVTLAVKRL